MCHTYLIIRLLLFTGIGNAVSAQNAGSTMPTYFPRRVFSDLKHSRYLDGKLQESWFGSQLFGLKEMPLIGRSPDAEPIYRFTLLPSFGHSVVVRVSIHPNGTATVVTRLGKGAGGYAPKGVLTDHSVELGYEKVQVLKNEVIASNFWHLPTEPNKQSGADGTEWLLEATESGRYHVVDRWEGADLHKLGLVFLNDVGHVGPEADLASSIQ